MAGTDCPTQVSDFWQTKMKISFLFRLIDLSQSAQWLCLCHVNDFLEILRMLFSADSWKLFVISSHEASVHLVLR